MIDVGWVCRCVSLMLFVFDVVVVCVSLLLVFVDTVCMC